MRFSYAALAALLLAACQPTIPDSAAGVGFGDYASYLREREAQSLSRQPAGSALTQRHMPIAESRTGDAGQTRTAALEQPLRAPMVPAATAAAPEETTHAPRPAGGISDEQSFDAVASRESIESDRERLERQRAQYQTIEVAAVPDASVASGPNVFEYALLSNHPVGESRYRRFNPLRWQSWERNCSRFAHQDLAQEHFLSRGGPERDPDNLDPDGDGYACWWDPAPIRQAARAGQ